MLPGVVTDMICFTNLFVFRPLINEGTTVEDTALNKVG